MKRLSTKKLTFIGMMGAITVILGLTPLGFIPVGLIRVTTLHIPTILAGIFQGPIVGALTGLLFGLFSLFQNLNAPTPLSFMFYDPLVSVFPRIMIGIVSAYVYRLFSKHTKPYIALGAAGVLGTLTNTVLVLGIGGLLHHRQIYEIMKIKAPIFLGTIAATNLPPELILSAIITIAVGTGLLKYRK